MALTMFDLFENKQTDLTDEFTPVYPVLGLSSSSCTYSEHVAETHENTGR